MPQLSVNIDHVATIRQARYRQSADYGEPDVVRIANEAEFGGADGITVHLREDRRHITDRDVTLLRATCRVRFNLEMAATDAMVAFAVHTRPHSAMLVPEGRDEVTTEGGLDVAGQLARLKQTVARLSDANCVVSAFIDAQERQIAAAYEAGFHVCEVHTGPYAERFSAAGGDFLEGGLAGEFERVREAGLLIQQTGMRFNAGHALNYHNVSALAALPGLSELHIGHAIVSRAIHAGMNSAVREMKRTIEVAAMQPNSKILKITEVTQ